MASNVQTQNLNKLDKAGIICSGACAVHCLLIPILAYASPLIFGFLKNEFIHLGLLIALVPIALIVFTKSQKLHGDSKPLILGAIGITLLISAVLLESIHLKIPYLEKILTGFGSLILIGAHITNLKLVNQSR
ncbi:MAG: MerC domain-containing protein [Bacteriovoracaceae bacterium]